MGFRLSVLIGASLLALGCVKDRPASVEARGSCVSCHTPHYEDAGSCADCHRGQPSAARADLAHARLLTGRAAEHSLTTGGAVTEGRQLIEAAACRRCHTIDGLGNRLATNLDHAVWKREQRELMTSITEPVENMPVFDFDRGQAEAVIAFLLNRARPGSSDETYRVQFARNPPAKPATFEEKCGGCHRLLTTLGPRGYGRRGPNLSALLTPFYPKTASGERAWSEKTLAEWVGNPRAARPSTIMPPAPLSDLELGQVLASIRDSGAPVRGKSP